MTENKRFVDYFDKNHNYIIQDLVNEDEYQVGFVNCDEDEFYKNDEGLTDKEIVDLLNEQDARIKELEKEKYRLNSKVKRLIDELANCYEKLGW